MKASELRTGEYGMTLENVLIIKTDKGYTVAYNHKVKRCSELPIDMEVKDVKTLTNEAEYIVQFENVVTVTNASDLEGFVSNAVINNKEIHHFTTTRI